MKRLPRGKRNPEKSTHEENQINKTKMILTLLQSHLGWKRDFTLEKGVSHLVSTSYLAQVH